MKIIEGMSGRSKKKWKGGGKRKKGKRAKQK
jgi:hypothetical protein